ncbi:MAG TPA: murein biosynthesis integral membrane protein MurJ [Pyrinomonadaceae bacterium]|nr:murein biosynthesis integral membrane protein MurJ [Pyrinomonadaceae bacterium]
MEDDELEKRVITDKLKAASEGGEEDPNPSANPTLPSSAPWNIDSGDEGVISHVSAAEVAGETISVVGESTGRFPRPSKSRRSESTAKGALMVGAGILISRIIGVIRQRVFSHYLGIGDAAGAFTAAFRIPNFLQNVFGEGALSASFIPVYANLLARGDKEEASRVADAVLTLLTLATSVIVLIGVLTTRYFVGLFAHSFDDATRELTIHLVQILFPGAGLLVLSAWCLGVLNSHRRFFLSYTAPVIWNVAIIATLVWFGKQADEFHLAEAAAWGSVAGSALQFGVQMPTVMKLIKRLRPVFDLATANVRQVLRNFFPVFVSRGVVQISAFIDAMLAGIISPQAVAALNYAQSLYTLPVSLFGMSISAAELPAMSSVVGSTDEIASQLRRRLDGGLRRIAFFIVPSAMAMLALGDVLTAALYQTGKFKQDATLYVWGILAGSTVGLLASTLGRMYASTYYALHDTRTPLMFASLRVVLTIGLGYLCAIPLPTLIGIDPKWGAAGLTASAGVAGWIEFALLRRALNKRIGRTGLPLGYVAKLWLAAAVGAAAGWIIRIAVGQHHPIIIAALVLMPYGLIYFAMTSALGLPETKALVDRVLKFVPGRKI